MHMRVFRLNTGSHMEADISIKEVWDSFFFPSYCTNKYILSLCLRDTVW